VHFTTQVGVFVSGECKTPRRRRKGNLLKIPGLDRSMFAPVLLCFSAFVVYPHCILLGPGSRSLGSGIQSDVVVGAWQRLAVTRDQRISALKTYLAGGFSLCFLATTQADSIQSWRSPADQNPSNAIKPLVKGTGADFASFRPRMGAENELQEPKTTSIPGQPTALQLSPWSDPKSSDVWAGNSVSVDLSRQTRTMNPC